MTREEAIKVVRNIYQTDTEKEALETLIPELAESEDERIRKALIDALKVSETIGELKFRLPYPTREECIAYLEKQKDSKWSPSEGEMGILYKLCYISNQITDEDDTELTRLYQDLKREYFNGHSFENMFPKEKQKENTWSEEDDAKVKAMCKEGDLKPSERAWLMDLKNRVWKEPQHAIRVTKGFGDPDGPQFELVDLPEEQKQWSEEDEKMLERAIHIIVEYSDIDEEESEIVQNWLKSLRPQPNKWYIKKGHWYMCIVDKPEYGWTKGKVYQSPEDNQIETNYKGSLTNWPDKEPWFRPATRGEIPDNQPHWKPSEEQMEAFSSYIKDFQEKAEAAVGGWNNFDVMIRLYEQLKKL